jgi:ribosomal protein S18 acetylase RimI-like enzyme
MIELTLRGWSDDDAEAAAGLTRRFFAPDPAWDASEARAMMTSDALGKGAHVRVAVRDGNVVGVGAYVLAPPWLFLWPVMGEDEAVHGELIDAAIAAGRAAGGVERARVSVRPIEPGKQVAVEARGFVRAIDFVEVVRASDADDARRERREVAGLVRREGAAIDRRAMHATHEAAFATLSNTAPMSEADFDHQLDGPRAWPGATAGWFAEDGTCAGFVLALRHADHGVVEAIGTHPQWRRRGLAAVMLEHLLGAAAREGVPEVRAMIASDNPASLALHEAAGFRRRGRKEVWELALIGPITGR